jgi:hypothetical protein
MNSAGETFCYKTLLMIGKNVMGIYSREKQILIPRS